MSELLLHRDAFLRAASEQAADEGYTPALQGYISSIANGVANRHEMHETGIKAAIARRTDDSMDAEDRAIIERAGNIVLNCLPASVIA